MQERSRGGLRLAGILFLVTGFGFVLDGFFPSASAACTTVNGVTTCQSTTTQSASTSVSTTNSPSPFSLTVRAQDTSGGTLSAQVFVDNTLVSPTTPYTTTGLSTGMHTVSCASTSSQYNPVSTVATVDSQPSISVTVTCTFALVTSLLSVSTVDISGNNVGGAISVDGTQVGVSYANVALPVGQHTLSCGPVSGYVTPSPQSFNVVVNTPIVKSCVYLTTGQSLIATTLTVSIAVCAQSAPCSSPYSFLAAQSVQLSDGQGAITDQNGNAVFTVLAQPGGSTFTATAFTFYGTAQGTITISGTAPAYLYLQVCCSGTPLISVVHMSLVATATKGMVSPGLEILLGGILSMVGIVLAVGGRRREG